jgi:hypothetical protein
MTMWLFSLEPLLEEAEMRRVLAVSVVTSTIAIAGCSSDSFRVPDQTDTGLAQGDTATPEDTGAKSDTASSPTDTSTPPVDSGKTCKVAADCPAEACVPRRTGDVVDGVYVCQPRDGEIHHGCLDACMGTSRCKAGECWKDNRTGSSLCTVSCEADGDCKNAGVACCKKPPSTQCLNGACIGGPGCAKTGICVPC